MIDSTIVELARRADLPTLVGKTIELRRESSNEWSGPCPLCGGSDRFHVKDTGWFCRQCHPEFGDAIEYMRWLHRLDFAGAVQALTGNVTPPSTPSNRQPVKAPPPKPAAQSSTWQAKTNELVEEAQGRLEQALPYLASRGLTAETAIRFRLGYRPDAPLPNTWDKQRKHITPPQPAIVIPWYKGGQLAAVRYRFLDKHTYTDTNSQERTVKQTSLHGSEFAGVLYGGQALPEFCLQPPTARPTERLRTLVLCEGEINAMSIYQVAHSWRWDVLSLGSESQKLTDGGRRFAERYGHVIVWMDKAEVAQTLMSQMAGAIAINSPVNADRKRDANDMLQSGDLADFLAAIYDRSWPDDECFLWDMWESYYA